MKVLVTGISGFLGEAIAELLPVQHELIGVGGKSRKGFFQKYYASEIDVLNDEPDLIVMTHGAVVSGSDNISMNELREANVEFTRSILKRFPNTPCIYTSTVSVFKVNESAIFENSEVDPTTEYALTKLEAEGLIDSHPNSTVVRLSSLFGPGMRENTILPVLVNQAIEQNEMTVYGNGNRTQNYIHVRDAAGLILKLIDEKGSWMSLYLGTYINEFSNNEIAEIISNLTGATIRYIGTDNSASFRYDNSRSRTQINWSPSISVEEGLKEYIEWKKRQY